MLSQISERQIQLAVSFFENKKQHAEIREDIDRAIKQVTDSGRFILGENVKALEEEVAAYCGAKYGIGVASGTDAIHLALTACGIKPGDEVITSPFTFVATIEAICYIGAKPVFIDIDHKTFTINAKKIAKKVTRKTKAILPVHLYGQAADMEPILDVSQKHKLKIVEDAAQAIGAEYKGRKACSLGDAGCLSFFPTKNLGCFGDGGMVLTNNEEVAEEVRVLRGHGSKVAYHYDLIGYNSRLDELQAAILRAKLKHLGRWEKKREKNVSIYDRELANIMEVERPFVGDGNKHVYNQYTIRAKNRNMLKDHLKSKGIGAMVYYPLSLHLHRAYSFLKYKFGDFPESEAAQEEVLSLPIFPELEEPQVKEVCAAINDFYLNF
jgi:dTDP-4-amino-4,6-dideoxygalactose transaminase